MVTSKSFDLGPPKSSWGSIFIKSQRENPHTLPKDLDFSNKVAIVTGGSTGLGYHACIHLLSFKLSHLIIAVRSIKRGNDAATTLRARFPKAKIEVWELEMTSYDSIQSFASRVEKNLSRLDMAILNSGLTKSDFQIVPGGHEEVIQVNYISTVLLSILLLPLLKRKPTSGPGRLTIVGSGTAYAASFANRNEVPLLKSFDNSAGWDPSERYWVSKLLLHYFMVKIVNYVDPKDVIVNLVDPGLCKGSGLMREAKGVIKVAGWIMKALLARTLEVGSTTYVDAVEIKDAESHGSYIMDWQIFPFAGSIHAPEGQTIADRLWNETMKELEFAGTLKVLEEMRR